jgi:hypothetical protein
MARPKKEIDDSQFRKLCGMQCTLGEISGFFDCSEDTVERWCKRNYGASFADTYKKYSASGKISLRRTQFRLAEKSAAMAIWLGKQYLGQRDEDVRAMTDQNNGILEAIYNLEKSHDSVE